MAVIFAPTLTTAEEGSLFGFNDDRTSGNDGTFYNYTFEPTGGPDGQGAIRYVWIPVAATGTQPYWGFQRTGLTLPGLGSSLFIRFKFYVGSSFHAGDDNGDPSYEPWGGKMVIVEASDRPMILIQPRTGLNDLKIRAAKSVGGPTNEATPEFDITSRFGGWINYQAEWRFSNSSNGYMKQWVTTNPTAHVYASPTGTSDTDINFAAGEQDFGIGYFSPYLAIGGSVDFRYCDIEVADSFATTWGTGGAPGGGAQGGRGVIAAIL